MKTNILSRNEWQNAGVSPHWCNLHVRYHAYATEDYTAGNEPIQTTKGNTCWIESSQSIQQVTLRRFIFLCLVESMHSNPHTVIWSRPLDHLEEILIFYYWVNGHLQPLGEAGELSTFFIKSVRKFEEMNIVEILWENTNVIEPERADASIMCQPQLCAHLVWYWDCKQRKRKQGKKTHVCRAQWKGNGKRTETLEIKLDEWKENELQVNWELKIP